MITSCNNDTLKYYVLKHLDTHADLDKDGEVTGDVAQYKNLSEAVTARNNFGNCYIDMRRFHIEIEI